METGISPEQIAALKERFRTWAQDPLKYRLMVAGAIALVGYYAAFSPLQSRLQKARLALKQAEARTEAAKVVLSQQAQLALFEDRVTIAKDESRFKQYVVGKLREAGLNVNSLATRKITQMGPYQVATIVLEAEGSYSQTLDFIDRIERGVRLARLDNLRFSKRRDSILFKVNVLGLQKSDG